MARHFAVIEFAPEAVRGCVFKAPGQPVACASERFHQKNERREALSRLVSALKEGLPGDGLKEVYLSLSPQMVSIRIVKVPFDDREKINGILPFELAGFLPADAEEFVFDNLPLQGGRAIAAGVEKGLLKECLGELQDLGIDPLWAGPAAFSASALSMKLPEGGGKTAFITPEFVSVSEGDRLLFLNTYGGTDSLRLNLELLRSEGVAPGSAYCSGLDPGVLQPSMPGVAVDKMDLPEGMEEMPSLYALSLLVKGRRLSDAALNFRKGEFEYTREKAAVRRRLKVAAFLCALLAVAGAADLYIRYLGASSEFAAYGDAIRAGYSSLFPDERGDSDAVYRMEVKMKLLDEEARALRGVDAAEVMRKLAAEAPRLAGLRVNELHVGEERISAKGEAGSFEAANQLRDALSKSGSFREVLLTDLKAKGGGGAVFTLSIRQE